MYNFFNNFVINFLASPLDCKTRCNNSLLLFVALKLKQSFLHFSSSWPFKSREYSPEILLSPYTQIA